MDCENKKITRHRIGCLISLIISIIITAIEAINIVDYFFAFIFFLQLDAIIVSLFIGSLFLSCKDYEYNGKRIIVYAGWFHHYVKIDGEIADEHNTLIFYVPIILSCKLDGGANLRATISLFYRITLKIDNRLCKNVISD